MLQKCPKYSFSDNIISKHRLIISYFLSGKNVFHKKMLLPKCSTLFSKSIFLLFHCPHLFNQRLFFLPSDCPNRQNELYCHKYYYIYSHLQPWKFVRKDSSSVRTNTKFPPYQKSNWQPNSKHKQNTANRHSHLRFSKHPVPFPQHRCFLRPLYL